MAKKSTAKKVDEYVAARQKEIDSALTDIIDNIDKWFLSAPFYFIEAGEIPVGEYLFKTNETTGFRRFHEWNDMNLCKLFPMAREAQRQLADESREDHSDEANELAFAVQRFGFVVGVLTGMKAMGISKEELKTRSEGFVYPMIEWERDRAKSDAAKAVNHGK